MRKKEEILYISLSAKIKDQWHEFFWENKKYFSGIYITDLVMQYGMEAFKKAQKLNEKK